ncbi:MAG: hypothetical protein M5U01_20740 [Ardenticatenaceae bacterium]|nr:hypothetical protein [Ardenticatenaceae bacterium]
MLTWTASKGELVCCTDDWRELDVTQLNLDRAVAALIGRPIGDYVDWPEGVRLRQGRPLQRALLATPQAEFVRGVPGTVPMA